MLSIKFKIVASYFLAGLALWFADAFLDYLIYFDGSFWDLLTKDPPARKIFTRTTIVLVCFVFGLITAIITTRKRKAEEALSEANERYRILLDNANDSVSMHEINKTGQSLGFKEVNHAACERFGYIREDLLKMPVSSVYDPDKLGVLQEAMTRLLTEKKIIFDTEYATSDGRRMPVEVSARLFHHEGKQMVLCVARELGQRKVN